MATTKQKTAARKNIKKARSVQGARAEGARISGRTQGMSAAEENRVPDESFAFPERRKEPLTDASHVRNAVARFDQVEGVSDVERDRAWGRIQSAARKYGVEISAGDWRELSHGGKVT